MPAARYGREDQQLTQSCSPAASRPALQPAFVCGNNTVNTTQPFNEPYRRVRPSRGGCLLSTRPYHHRRRAVRGPRRLGVVLGRWDNAAGNTNGLGWTNGDGGPDVNNKICSDPATLPVEHEPHLPVLSGWLFQFHHQPFNYYANYAPNTPGRAHLQDELNFEQLAQSSDKETCNLKDVSFIKPIGEENEHPGYASLPTGSDHSSTCCR